MCPTIVAHLRIMQPKSLVSREMVGDPGIEPGMGLPGGVTVRCRTLQHVARRRPEIAKRADGVNWKIGRAERISAMSEPPPPGLCDDG